MAHDDYFSFGDEEIEADLGADQDTGTLRLATALIGGTEEDTEIDDGAEGTPSKAAGRDSLARKPIWERLSSPRVLLAASLVAAVAFGIVWFAISAPGGKEPSSRAPSTSEAEAPFPATPPAAAVQPPVARAERQRAAERQRVRRQRAETRRRARRRRQRAASERRAHAERHRVQPDPQAPAPESPLPTYEESAPPASSASPEPPQEPAGEPRLHDGASSPEFGL